MIPKFPISELNLGHDGGWMTNDDAARQQATVERLLRSFCGAQRSRCEIQLLADEVGMGKTFVALATAYAMLSTLRDREAGSMDDLDACYPCVLVITPGGNHPLSKKWDREVEAMLNRCSIDKERTAWFKSQLCEDSDQLLQAILRANDLRRKVPVVLIAEATVFSKRLGNPSARFFAACLFRFWGNALPIKERARLVRGLASAFDNHWRDLRDASSDDLHELWDWKEHARVFALNDEQYNEEWDYDKDQARRWRLWLFRSVSLRYEQVRDALERLPRDEKTGANLLDLRTQCLDTPQRSNHGEWALRFNKLRDEIRRTYKAIWPYLLGKHFPLVIADEAHHWRNGGVDVRNFRENLAPFTRRLLMLTATPFQLYRDELQRVLDVSQSMTGALGEERCAEFKRLKEALAQGMTGAETAGFEFSREWGRLGEQFALVDRRFSVASLRERLDNGEERVEELLKHWARLHDPAMEASGSDLSIPSPLRPFFNAAQKMKAANDALTRAMKPIIVRHRRRTEHRRYWVGREYPPAEKSMIRPDQGRLHLAPGTQIPEDAELVQYLLMKAVAALHRGQRKTALCSALTGSYSTLWSSKDGRSARQAFERPENQSLFKIIRNLTGGSEITAQKKDENHPKLRAVTHEILRRWDLGEKSLVFCFRVPTAQALDRAISNGIELRLRGKRRALLKARGTEIGTESDAVEAMQQFRSSLTAREGTGVPLFLDRVLLAWCMHHAIPIPEPTAADLHTIATICLRARSSQRQKERAVFMALDRTDRVFIHRALEHVMAGRMLREGVDGSQLTPNNRECTHRLLEHIGLDENWICYRYGIADEDVESFGGESSSEQAARSSLNAKYWLDDVEPDAARIDALAAVLTGRIETLWSGPNLLAPRGELSWLKNNLSAQETIAEMRRIVVEISRTHDESGWIARRQILDALVRALLREDILLRLPTDVFKDKEETWSESLLRGIHTVDTSSGRHESLAVRVLDFVREMKDIDHKEREAKLRYALKPNAKAVELVSGSNHSDRDAIFSGFNTPLLPDVLVCTQVGQEGIDLHRQCRHVIHYDLGWNPATVEQRTGRVDRLGSMAMRERKLAAERDPQKSDMQLPGLEIALPYLAGTYDERMFNVLRTRAQRFEILTGGDPSAEKEQETMWHDDDDEGDADDLDLVPLPEAMLKDLRVDLEVPRK